MNINTIIGLSNIIFGLMIIAVCIPLLKDGIEMNCWYGIRFKKSFESKENWYKINRYGAKRMILWSVVVVVISILTFFVPIGSKGILPLIFSCAPLTFVIPAIESWLFAKKL